MWHYLKWYFIYDFYVLHTFVHVIEIQHKVEGNKIGGWHTLHFIDFVRLSL